MSDDIKSDNLLVERVHCLNYTVLDPTVSILDPMWWLLAEREGKKCKLIPSICLLYLFLPTNSLNTKDNEIHLSGHLVSV